MEKVVVLESNNYIYKDKVYEYSELNSLISKLGKSLKIFILKENIFIRRFNLEEKYLDKFIKDTIRREAEIDCNLLFHYEYNKHNKILYVYSLKKGEQIKKLAANVTKLSVIPIQFFINNLIEKKGKDNEELIIMAKIKNIVYVVVREKGQIVQNYFMTMAKFDFLKEASLFESSKRIIVDNALNTYIPKEAFTEYNITFRKIGENFNG